MPSSTPVPSDEILNDTYGPETSIETETGTDTGTAKRPELTLAQHVRIRAIGALIYGAFIGSLSFLQAIAHALFHACGVE